MIDSYMCECMWRNCMTLVRLQNAFEAIIIRRALATNVTFILGSKPLSETLFFLLRSPIRVAVCGRLFSEIKSGKFNPKLNQVN